MTMEELKEKVIEVLRGIFDPEIPANIYELGLIYGITLDKKGNAHIQMTLTSPACPVAGQLVADVETRVRGIEGVGDVKVELTWEPPWGPERMSEAAKLQLGM